jgi:hypothetical protein
MVQGQNIIILAKLVRSASLEQGQKLVMCLQSVSESGEVLAAQWVSPSPDIQ